MGVTKELPINCYQELGSKISCLNDPKAIKAITDALRDSHLSFKAGTFAVLEAASELFHSEPPVQFVLGGEPYVLDYQVLHCGETAELKYLDYHKCDAEISVKAVNQPQRFPPEKLGLGHDFTNGVIALRYLGFDVHRERPNMCDVYGVVMTRKGFEGQGLALGLGLLTDVIIRDVHQRKIISQEVSQYWSLIQDNSSSQDKQLNRRSWSSNLAYLLGYKRTDYSEQNAINFMRVISLP
ncbi:hypothetical protein HYT02_02450 [Candidatus Gottesmanbacteria bacterium]|nr:hypothetical protein [Candidatus Gottesmanbacteria bacterium]